MVDDREAEVVRMMCACDMNVSRAAEKMYMHRNSVVYYIGKIQKKYGLDPCCYQDLKKLEQMAEGGEAGKR